MTIMKAPALLAGVTLLSLGNWGCLATKKHVQQAIAPVQNQVNAVQKQTADNKQAIGDLDRQVSVTDEKATDAGKAAKDANLAAAKANDAALQAGQRADGARSLAQETSDALRGTVDNLDNYRLADTKKVYFSFGKSKLTPDQESQLSDLVKTLGSMKGVVIEVEGYTDRVGAKNYNLTLSQQRADAVVRYLASQNVPLRMIHQLGVGEADTGGRRANKDDRRVDVRVFTRQLPGSSSSPSMQSQNSSTSEQTASQQ
jgi:outer membrane protein OmpA-like peptidoglycan-associated protein